MKRWIVLAGLTASFLLGLDWQRVTPILLLIAGAGMLARQATASSSR